CCRCHCRRLAAWVPCRASPAAGRPVARPPASGQGRGLRGTLPRATGDKRDQRSADFVQPSPSPPPLPPRSVTTAPWSGLLPFSLDITAVLAVHAAAIGIASQAQPT